MPTFFKSIYSRSDIRQLDDNECNTEVKYKHEYTKIKVKYT